MQDNSVATENSRWSRTRCTLNAAWRRLCLSTRNGLGLCWAAAKGTVSAAVTIATVGSGITAAIAAYYAREAAQTVVVMESKRLAYEKNKYSSDMYQRLVDFIRTAGPVTPCLTALKDLNGDEIRKLWDKPAEFAFHAANEAHVRLAQCLPVNEDRQKYGKAPETWTRDQSYAVKGTMVIWLNQIDAYLLLFRRDIGNQGILCENIITWIASDGPFRHLLVKMNDEKLLSPVANVKSFLDRYGSGKEPCPSVTPSEGEQMSEPFVDSLLRKFADLLGLGSPDSGRRAASD